MTQKDSSNTDFNPKHRIVGAIIVVSLAVIFVPMILNENAPLSEPMQLAEIPKRIDKDTPAESRVVIMPVAPSADASAALQAGPTATPSAVSTAGPGAAREAAISSAPQTKTASAKTRKARHATPAEAHKAWVVQVGTFANLRNATRLRDKLKGRGYSVNEENISLQGNQAVRLRVGPFSDRPAALKARTEIHKDIGVRGVVLAQQ